MAGPIVCGSKGTGDWVAEASDRLLLPRASRVVPVFSGIDYHEGSVGIIVLARVFSPPHGE